MEQHRFSGQSVLLVTGRLAEPAIRRMLPELEERFQVSLELQVMPITVAALMSIDWIQKHLDVPEYCDAILLPGYCQPEGHGQEPVSLCGVPAFFGPKDFRRLPEYFGGKMEVVSLEHHAIEIIAEINHAPRLSIPTIIAMAESMQRDGADVIDIGCEPGSVWKDVGTVTRELVDRGFKVSIDSLNPGEIEPAVNHGATLVLSVNSSNRRAAVDWDCAVIAIPDDPGDWLAVADTVDFLARHNVELAIDPIIEPVGFGFARSLERYFEARKIWPEAAMMMGIGNLSELSDVDSAGVNFLLLAICDELMIDRVLTTQVINWARSSVRECDIARRLVHLANTRNMPPKNVTDQLVCLRDTKSGEVDETEIADLARAIRDHNYRILAGTNPEAPENPPLIHLLGGGQHWKNQDAFELFHQLMESNPGNLDPSHAFYLGYEMCKATIANQLGKKYEQDEALRWGHLTVEEISHRRLKRKRGK